MQKIKNRIKLKLQRMCWNIKSKYELQLTGYMI